MKTNFVKNNSEKNIEMFKMSNEEMEVVNGGQFVAVQDDEGNIIVIWVNRAGNTNNAIMSRY